MEYSITDECIGCGLCASLAPDFFALGDSGKAEIVALPGDSPVAREAKEQCPVGAIRAE
jgi:ferredoxin